MTRLAVGLEAIAEICALSREFGPHTVTLAEEDLDVLRRLVQQIWPRLTYEQKWAVEKNLRAILPPIPKEVRR